MHAANTIVVVERGPTMTPAEWATAWIVALAFTVLGIYVITNCTG